MSGNGLSNIDLAALGRMTLAESLAVIGGEDLEFLRAKRLELNKIVEEAEGYKLVMPSNWPNLNFNWDFSADAQRFALDGCKSDSFANSFPLGLRLGWVSLPEFDAKLSPHNRRELSELWDVGDQSKLAIAIAYIHKGKPITPPLVGCIPVKKQVFLSGGNHRYTVAKFSGEIELPIYVAPEDAERIGGIVTIRWV